MFTHIPAKHEMVLMHVLNGLPGSHAYAMVYGQDRGKATCEVNASRILSSAKVKARRAELLAARAAATPISVEYLTREALATVGEARALGQGSAALQGYQFVAKLHGLLIDRQQTDVLIRKPSASPASPDELSAEQWLSEYAVTNQITKEPEPEGSEIINTSDILTQPEDEH
jgi:hypothetical protein